MAFDGQHSKNEPKLNALLRLADILEKKEGMQYNHAVFAWPLTRLEGPGCKTSACALGWATLEMGKELNLKLFGDIPAYVGGKRPVTDPYKAGAMAFNITLDESEFLFDMGYNFPHNGQEAAQMIRDFVATKVKEQCPK